MLFDLLSQLWVDCWVRRSSAEVFSFIASNSNSSSRSRRRPPRRTLPPTSSRRILTMASYYDWLQRGQCRHAATRTVPTCRARLSCGGVRHPHCSGFMGTPIGWVAQRIRGDKNRTKLRILRSRMWLR